MSGLHVDHIQSSRTIRCKESRVSVQMNLARRPPISSAAALDDEPLIRDGDPPVTGLNNWTRDLLLVLNVQVQLTSNRLLRCFTLTAAALRGSGPLTGTTKLRQQTGSGGPDQADSGAGPAARLRSRSVDAREA